MSTKRTTREMVEEATSTARQLHGVLYEAHNATYECNNLLLEILLRDLLLEAGMLADRLDDIRESMPEPPR